MKEGSFHLFFTFPSTPSKTHPPQKENARKIVHSFSFSKVSQEKIVINFVFVLFLPDLENCKSKGVETFPLLTFFHTQHCWPSFMYYVRKNCIHYANFHDCNFFWKNCELFWRQRSPNFFLIVMMYLIAIPM